MWLSPSRIVRRRMTPHDLRISSLNAFEKPLAALGFKPKAVSLVFMDIQRPLCAYAFVRNEETLSVVFSRARPFWFLHKTAKIQRRSPEYGTLDELEAGLAAYFKIPNFSPQTRPVIDWPVRKPLPPLPTPEDVPCLAKAKKPKRKSSKS